MRGEEIDVRHFTDAITNMSKRYTALAGSREVYQFLYNVRCVCG